MAATPQMLPAAQAAQSPELRDELPSKVGLRPQWQIDLKKSIRDIQTLCHILKISEDGDIPKEVFNFPCLVTESFLQRMRIGDANDPLLRQVLPVRDEATIAGDFVSDPVGDLAARSVDGMLHKYHGRALLILSGSCAIHCRYCFRREYPYSEDPKDLADWQPAFQAIMSDDSIKEVILSGGDPLMMTDQRLGRFLKRLSEIPHLQRIRIHSRLPVVLPSRVTDELIAILKSTRLQPIFVIHANHPAELVADCAAKIRILVQSGIPTLNQAVLLNGINDDIETLVGLCETCINNGVIPYYLHQLDRVAGAAHFEVDETKGLELIQQLRERLPGYAIPKFVREIPGEPSKTVLPQL